MYLKSGPTAGQRRLPARVLDIQGETATIELCHNQSVREVKFQHLDPDLDWLSKVYEERDRAERKRLVREAQYGAMRTPDLRTPLPIPQPKAEPAPVVDYDKVPDVPQVTMSEPPVDNAADVAAYLDLGDAILRRLNTAIEAAPQAERAPLEAQRDGIVQRMTETKNREGVDMGKPPKKYMAKDPDVKAAVLKDIRAGMTDRQIVAKYKISSGTAWTWRARDKESPKKVGGTFPVPYPEATRLAVLADVAAGKMQIVDIAKKHGVHPGTVHSWKAGKGGGKPGPKPKAAVEVEHVEHVAPAAPRARAGVAKAQEENRRLRGALAKLLAQEPRVDDVVALVEDNRRLRVIIDMWLGLS
jgi:transposase-like protein